MADDGNQVQAQQGHMAITYRRINRVDVLALRGRVQLQEATMLRAAISQLMEQGRTNLVLELTNLNSISSSGSAC